MRNNLHEWEDLILENDVEPVVTQVVVVDVKQLGKTLEAAFIRQTSYDILHRVDDIDESERFLDEPWESISEGLGSSDVSLILLDVVTPLYELIVHRRTAHLLLSRLISARLTRLQERRIMRVFAIVSEVAIALCENPAEVFLL
jgi:hypothetical protein